MATKKGKSKNRGKIVGILVAILVLFLVWKFVINKKNPEETTTTTTGGSSTGTTTTTTGTSTTKVTDDTVFYAKKPYPKDERVKWIQSTYNSYIKERKSAGRTPDYPSITVDGVYGANTANAVYRLMGQYHTSWKAFKARIDYYRGNNYQG